MLGKGIIYLINKFKDWNLNMFLNKVLGCVRKIIILWMIVLLL